MPRAEEDDQGVLALVLDLAKAFERVSLPVVWAWATHFSFPRKILRVMCGYFEHLVLQDALREVTNFYRPLKLRVFVDEIKALGKRKNKELAQMKKK